MRENRLSGSEGGAALRVVPTLSLSDMHFNGGWVFTLAMLYLRAGMPVLVRL